MCNTPIVIIVTLVEERERERQLSFQLSNFHFQMINCLVAQREPSSSSNFLTRVLDTAGLFTLATTVTRDELAL